VAKVSGTVNPDGESAVRDFAHVVSSASPSIRYRLSRAHSLWVGYMVKRKDFREQSELGSLDWWKHGPSVQLRSRVGHSGDIEIDYTFRVQSYDEDPASLASGGESASNPDEEHFFHRVEVEGLWRSGPRLEARLGYAFERRDDRFQDFESWDDYGVSAGLTWVALSRLTVAASGGYHRREYDHRPADGAGTLEYDKFSTGLSVGAKLTPELGTYATMEYITRDTTRSTGLEYRDFDILKLVAGVSFAY
jgi:hypothetical protein